MAKKLYPVNRLDITYMEHWLSKLAEEGFFPTHFGTYFVTGNKDVPQKAKYCFVPLDGSDKRAEPTPEERELFLATGWEFVNHLDERFLVFQNKEDYPKEIPLADEVQQERFQSLAKRFQRDYIIGWLCILFALGLFVFLLLRNFHEFILFEDAILKHSSLFIFFFTLPFGHGITRKSLYRLKSYGEDIKNLVFDREEDMVVTAPRIFVNAMRAFAGVLIPILYIAALWGMFGNSDEGWITIEQTTSVVPQISLEELTGDTVEYQESCYKEEYTIFAPTQYNIKQIGIQNVIAPLENGQLTSTNEIVLYWNYYELISSELAEVTFDTWMTSDDGTPSGFNVDEEEKISIDTDLLDKAYIHATNGGWHSFWFLDDNVIVTGEYIGGNKEAIVENLDLFADIMK